MPDETMDTQRNVQKSPNPSTKPQERDLFNKFLDDDFWLEPFDFFRGSSRSPSALSRQGFPRVDIGETNSEMRVIAEVPGVNPEHIEIDIQDRTLRIRGRMEREIKSDEKPYHYERVYGEFTREFLLPSQAKEDQVRASYKDGLLTITLPKFEEEEKRRKIPIERQ